jgi:hypothetical protein
MKKLKQILQEYFDPYFEKYSDLISFEFNIYNFDGEIYFAEEDFGCNDKRWDDYLDTTGSDCVNALHDALNKLPECYSAYRPTIISIINNLSKNESDNPMSRMLEDVWDENRRIKLCKKCSSYIKRNFAWKYIDYVSVKVDKNKGVVFWVDGTEEEY